MIDTAASHQQPNIVVLISHDLGCHIGPYGYAAEQTPCLNRFAAEGLRLDRHFVSSPGCSQSRSSLVTGRYPHANGQFGLANWGWKLNEDERLLPQSLREALRAAGGDGGGTVAGRPPRLPAGQRADAA